MKKKEMKDKAEQETQKTNKSFMKRNLSNVIF